MQATLESSTLSWGDILRLWWRFAPLLLLSGILGGGGAYLLASRMTPVYDASAVILFSRSEGANLGGTAGNLGNAADAAPTDAQQRAALVRSQIEIIRGSDIIQRVIAQLKLQDSPTFWVSPGLVARIGKALENLTGITMLAPAPDAGANSMSRIVQQYLDRLVVRHEPESYILRIGFRGPDPVEAAAIANAHVAAYRSWLREQQVSAIQGSSAWLARAVEHARARVLAAEAAVQQDQRAGMLVSIDGRTSLDQEIAQMTAELATAQASLVRSEVRAGEITRMRANGQLAALAAMSNSRTFIELRDRATMEDAKVAAARITLGTGSPQRQAAEATSRQLNAALQNEIQALLQSETSQASIAHDTVARLTEALDGLKKRVLEAESSRARLASLEGEATTERTVYLSLLQRLRALDNVSALSRSEATVLSPAPVPPDATSPRRGVFSAFGFCLFAGLAAGGVVWRQGARDVIRHTADAISSGVRCLAVMPEFKRDRPTGQLDCNVGKYSFFLQELRALCAVLFREYARPGQESLSVLVTSPLSGDGKSTFCRELGRCAAMNGVSVLIISTDSTAQEHGGQAGQVYELEHGLPLSGVALSVANEIFRLRDARNTIERYKADYGLVIIDTPPLSAMAESVLLAAVADATVVLARVDRTPRSLLTRVVQQIDKVGGNLAGIVVTFAQLDSRRGLLPGDFGYYFAQNKTYHQQRVEARFVGHSPASRAGES